MTKKCQLAKGNKPYENSHQSIHPRMKQYNVHKINLSNKRLKTQRKTYLNNGTTGNDEQTIYEIVSDNKINTIENRKT